MTALSNQTHPRITIWIWPTGLFPRRIMYFLRAKKITLSTLIDHNIHLIPVSLKPSGSLDALEGYESRPPKTSLPCMRVERPGEETFVVRESISIMEYLEEVFGQAQGYEDLQGSTIKQRSRTRDILSVYNDAFIWSTVSSIHSDPRTTSWSGMNLEQQSLSAARDAKHRFHFCLSKIEKWVEEDVIAKGTKSSAGEGSICTLADIILMAVIEYLREAYGEDWIEEHGVLRIWCDRAKNESWYLGREQLERCEKEGWKVVLGA